MEKREGTRKRRREGSGTPPPRTLKQYSVEEKLDIIDYAKSTGNRAAGREFNVAESSIREWRKHEIKLRETLANGGASAKSSKATTPSTAAPPHPLLRLPSTLSLLPTLTASPSTGSSISSCPSTSSSPSSDLSIRSSSISTNGDSEISGSRRRKATAPRKIVLED
ncbi:hypothetical protein PFISCL1PPCAC_2626 [Pristionchus fissidentatus]|uniref:Brinker DNA-binding domain-containing protein n=1 Tax=Pristionchus fissidentatus TaxID=1538716 RepID=A0AAV5UW32_9BILA|nr:hypothetical protein PFISCL1PPCAC_2626 [Pristionchus fissidentatus]